MRQYITLKEGTKLNVESIISLGSLPKEVIEIRFSKEEEFQKLFNIYSEKSENYNQDRIDEFSIYSVDENSDNLDGVLQGVHYGFCKLISIKFDGECCAVKLEKLSDYDITISQIKNSIKDQSIDANARILELENIIFDLMSLKN